MTGKKIVKNDERTKVRLFVLTNEGKDYEGYLDEILNSKYDFYNFYDNKRKKIINL